MEQPILIPLADNPALGKDPLEWSLALWGDENPWFSPDQWRSFYSESAHANYQNWDAEGRDQELIYIAVTSEKVVGAIAIVDFDDIEDFRHLKPWVAAFIVDPTLRGKGLGSQILEALEGKAREFGITRLYLWTEDRKDFYLKRGYSLVTHKDYPTKSIDVLSKAL